MSCIKSNQLIVILTPLFVARAPQKHCLIAFHKLTFALDKKGLFFLKNASGDLLVIELQYCWMNFLWLRHAIVSNYFFFLDLVLPSGSCCETRTKKQQKKTNKKKIDMLQTF